MTISTSLSLTEKLTLIVAEYDRVRFSRFGFEHRHLPRGLQAERLLKEAMQDFVGVKFQSKKSGRVREIASAECCYCFQFAGKGEVSPDYLLENYTIISC